METVLQRHLLTLTYSGLLADQGAMDVTFAGAVQVGARRLLSASAHFDFYGFVPVRLAGRSQDFAIVELPAEHGSVIRKYAVLMSTDFANNAAYEALKDGPSLRNVLIFAVASAATILLEREQWAVEIGSLLRQQSPMPASRVEPVLPWPARETPLSDHVGNDRFEAATLSPELALVVRGTRPPCRA